MLSVSEELKSLSEATKELNKWSDSLNQVLDCINDDIGKIGAGVAAWFDYSEKAGEWSRGIGYSRVNGKWGLALRYVKEGTNGRVEEVWRFNEASRWMRVEAIPHIPNLIATLTKRVEEMTNRVIMAHSQANEIAEATRGK